MNNEFHPPDREPTKRTVTLTCEDGEEVDIGDTVVQVKWPEGRSRGRRVVLEIEAPRETPVNRRGRTKRKKPAPE